MTRFQTVIRTCFLASGLTALFLVPTHGQNRTFNGSAGGNWNNPANWTPNDVPDTASENAIIGGGGAFTVTLDTSPSVGTLTIGGNDTLQQLNSRDISVFGNSITNNGLYEMLDLGSLTDLRISAANVTLNGTGTLRMNGSNNNRILAAGAANILTNGASHTIEGGGRLGDNALDLINNGLVHANNATLRVQPGAARSVTNNGTMQADGGVLELSNGTFQKQRAHSVTERIGSAPGKLGPGRWRVELGRNHGQPDSHHRHWGRARGRNPQWRNDD